MLEKPKALVTLWPALQGAEAHSWFGHGGVGIGGDGIAIGWAPSAKPSLCGFADSVVTGQLLFLPLQEVSWGLIPKPSGFSPPCSIASVLSVSV